MREYPLKDFADFIECEGVRCGVAIGCPNCGTRFSAWFTSTVSAKWKEYFPNRPTWQHAGDSLETLSLDPSFMFTGHCHSWIRNGKICVDSEFECKPQAMSA